jgi:aryl-alcohol dehydrogenase-like predicted oxidoreductase
MKYINLGKSGLKVSRICLGTMAYADGAGGWHPWALNEEASQPFYKRAFEAGINFFDTANVYSFGTSEEFLGRAVKKYSKREEVVIATKACGEMRPGDPNGKGLSRKAIFTEIDHSLRRLGTDYIDLYQIHRLDPETPIEETLEALNDVVKAGKARYIGASSMFAWQFMQTLALQSANGWARFISMQNHVNLLYREEEREMLPLCIDQGIGVIPWSPLARGRLARPFGEKTERSQSDRIGSFFYRKSDEIDGDVINRVGEVAAARGLPRAQIALAWLLAKPGVTAPIVGATKLEQLNDSIAALDVTLSAEEITRLEELYVPHEVSGHS